MPKNKVKKIIKRNNAMKNIVSIVTKLLILNIAGVAVVFFGMSIVNSFVLESDSDMNELVNLTNEYWNDPVKLDERVASLIAESDNFDAVLFVDNDLEVIHNASTVVPDFSDSGRFSYENVRRFRWTGILREESTRLDFSYGLPLPDLLNTIDIITFSTSSNKLERAQKKTSEFRQWIVYETDIDSVNVCAEYVYNVSAFHSSLLVLCIALFSIIIVLIFISIVFFGFTIIRRNMYARKIIYTDPVTGGYNKDFFITYAIRSLKKKKKYAVVQFRLEKYRNYCTAYGTKQGERLLEMIYVSGKQKLYRNELIAHLEGADYALLLQYYTKEKLEQRLRNMLNDFNTKSGGRHLLFSAGICPVQKRGDDASFVLTSAGLALSKTKNQSSHIVWFNDDMKQEQIWERRVEDDMEKALANHEFQVYLQPKYSTKKEKLAAAEALVRWIHPELGFISPGKFIPIFETNGFILQLDDYMLREIARLQAEWLREGKKLVPISVNVSRAHFSMDDLAEHICAIVDEYNVPHEFIELELTESAFFDDKATLLSTVKKLKQYGFKLSMDDFGAGYSSLNSLKELPLDIIKLDAEFFRGIEDVKRANAIVGDTIALAKKLGMEIVAEGIETREQVDFLAGQNCDLIQGFYFAKPLPVSEFIERAWGKTTK